MEDSAIVQRTNEAVEDSSPSFIDLTTEEDVPFGNSIQTGQLHLNIDQIEPTLFMGTDEADVDDFNDAAQVSTTFLSCGEFNAENHQKEQNQVPIQSSEQFEHSFRPSVCSYPYTSTPFPNLLSYNMSQNLTSKSIQDSSIYVNDVNSETQSSNPLHQALMENTVTTSYTSAFPSYDFGYLETTLKRGMYFLPYKFVPSVNSTSNLTFSSLVREDSGFEEGCVSASNSNISVPFYESNNIGNEGNYYYTHSASENVEPNLNNTFLNDETIFIDEDYNLPELKDNHCDSSSSVFTNESDYDLNADLDTSIKIQEINDENIIQDEHPESSFILKKNSVIDSSNNTKLDHINPKKNSKVTTETNSDYSSNIKQGFASILKASSRSKTLLRTFGPLKNHRRTHFKKKPNCISELLVCTKCDYSSYNRSNFKNHLFIHSDERLFACPHCSYKGKQSAGLRAHLKVHSVDKPFNCNICDYKCKRKQNLIQHFRIHSKFRPFSCNYCSYTSTTKQSLQKHLVKHYHGIIVGRENKMKLSDSSKSVTPKVKINPIANKSNVMQLKIPPEKNIPEKMIPVKNPSRELKIPPDISVDTYYLFEKQNMDSEDGMPILKSVLLQNDNDNVQVNTSNHDAPALIAVRDHSKPIHEDCKSGDKPRKSIINRVRCPYCNLKCNSILQVKYHILNHEDKDIYDFKNSERTSNSAKSSDQIVVKDSNKTRTDEEIFRNSSTKNIKFTSKNRKNKLTKPDASFSKYMQTLIQLIQKYNSKLWSHHNFFSKYGRLKFRRKAYKPLFKKKMLRNKLTNTGQQNYSENSLKENELNHSEVNSTAMQAQNNFLNVPEISTSNVPQESNTDKIPPLNDIADISLKDNDGIFIPNEIFSENIRRTSVNINVRNYLSQNLSVSRRNYDKHSGSVYKSKIDNYDVLKDESNFASDFKKYKNITDVLKTAQFESPCSAFGDIKEQNQTDVSNSEAVLLKKDKINAPKTGDERIEVEVAGKCQISYQQNVDKEGHQNDNRNNDCINPLNTTENQVSFNNNEISLKFESFDEPITQDDSNPPNKMATPPNKIPEENQTNPIKSEIKHSAEELQSVFRMGTHHCNRCESSFKKKSSLVNHQRSHAKDIYVCSKCPYTFRYLKAKYDHEALHLLKTTYNCSKCNFSTMHKQRFLSHDQKHKYSCVFTDCKFSCSLINDMKTHELEHQYETN